MHLFEIQRTWRGLFVASLLLPMASIQLGCSDPEVSGDACDSNDDCPDSKTCVAHSCLDVCYGVTIGDGSVGALCRIDGDCDLGECDNTSRLSSCRCECEPFATNVGGSASNPEVWEERYTCIEDDGSCFGIENTAVTLALVQNESRVDWSITAGAGTGSQYFGDLCDTSFRWESQPGTAAEEGCWEFTADRFNKLSYGDGFTCVGSGSKGAGSSPASAPSCSELASAGVDIGACPAAPPASPLD